jgi:hypothetical protein
VRLRNERPSAPALRLLEPHALAAVTNIAWLEEYDPRLLERPLKCLERACPRIGSAALDILDRDLGYPRRFCQIDLQVGARICNGLGIMRACLETQRLEQLEARMDEIARIAPARTRTSTHEAQRHSN